MTDFITNSNRESDDKDELTDTKPVSPPLVVEKHKHDHNPDNYNEHQVSFSGADAVATIIVPTIGSDGNPTGPGEIITLGDIQTLSYSMHRENSPVRTLGHVNPRGFIKGGRTIAGSFIFTVFNEYAFYRITQYRELLARRNGFFAPLADMLPPFDIVVTFFNEYGNMSKMKIFGVTIVDEGQTVSIDDLIIEQTYTYMARGIQPMVKMVSPHEQTGANNPNSTQDPSILDRNLNIQYNIFGDQVVDDLAKLFQHNMIDESVDF